MFDFIAIPFAFIMRFCYDLLFSNYGLALILFTLITKLVLFPLAVKQHISLVKGQMVQPKIDKLRKQYANNKEKLNEETMKLHAEEGVNPMGSCLPLLIQMPILMGLYDVVRRPIHHILEFSQDTINSARDILLANKASIDVVKDVSDSSITATPDTYIIKAVQEAPEVFNELGTEFVTSISEFNYTFFGLDLGMVPSFTNILILVPIVSFLVNICYTLFTQHKAKRYRTDRTPSQPGGKFLLYFSPVFSAIIAFSFPAGLGIYWIWSSAFMFLQSFILYSFYTEKRLEKVFAKAKTKKKTNGKKSMYDRMLEAQKAQAVANGAPVKNSSSDEDSDDVKLSKSELKEVQRKTLNEARKRMAEKYGDEYTEE